MGGSDLLWSELVKACSITALFSSVIILLMLNKEDHFRPRFFPIFLFQKQDTRLSPDNIYSSVAKTGSGGGGEVASDTELYI